MNEHDTLPPGGMGPLDPTDIGPHGPDKTGLRCPSWPSERQENSGLIGCGSTNILWDGFEMWDCLDCGLFFTTEEGTPPDVLPA